MWLRHKTHSFVEGDHVSSRAWWLSVRRRHVGEHPTKRAALASAAVAVGVLDWQSYAYWELHKLPEDHLDLAIQLAPRCASVGDLLAAVSALYTPPAATA